MNDIQLMEYFVSETNKENDINFLSESNKIEGILCDPTDQEINEYRRFINLKKITVHQVKKFVSVYQPNAVIRDKEGMDVMVGCHVPPKGGHEITVELKKLLKTVDKSNPFYFHVAYETLHPFTDGNGRSGRAIWAWQMVREYNEHPSKFLHTFYYQSLEYSQIMKNKRD